MKYYTKFNTPLCQIILVGDNNGLSNLHLNTNEGDRTFSINEKWKDAPAFFKGTVNQLQQYFTGDRQNFNIPISPEGTPFQQQVWQAVRQIPYGKVCSYKDIAITLNNPRAYRAVGMANSKNPIPIIIPCHRVIGSNNKLVGFAHGLTIKEKLLQLEKESNR